MAQEKHSSLKRSRERVPEAVGLQFCFTHFKVAKVTGKGMSVHGRYALIKPIKVGYRETGLQVIGAFRDSLVCN